MSEPEDDLAAALRARRDLGPEYDEAIANRLAERMHEEIARQVRAKLDQERAALPQRLNSNQRVAITIVSLGVGFLSTGVAVGGNTPWLAVVIWAAIALIGVTVNFGRR